VYFADRTTNKQLAFNSMLTSVSKFVTTILSLLSEPISGRELCLVRKSVKSLLSAGIKTPNRPAATAHFQVNNYKNGVERHLCILGLDAVSLEWIMCVGTS